VRTIDCPICKDKLIVEAKGKCRNCGEMNVVRTPQGHTRFLTWPCEYCGVGPDGRTPGKKKKLKPNECGVEWDSSEVWKNEIK
jgi:hypothetical protein